MPTIAINEALVPDFMKKLEKLNKRAVKLGMAPVTAKVTSLFDELRGNVGQDRKPLGACRVLVDGKTRWSVVMANIEITGQAPKVNGYTFVATVDLRGDEPVVRALPFTEADLTPYWSTDSHCDHCDTHRRRNDVLIVREEATGKLMQIGRNCAADFFRSSDALNMLAVSEWDYGVYGSDFEDNWISIRSEPYVTLKHLFETAAAVVRVFGWVSASAADRDETLTSTRSRVWANLYPFPGTPQSEFVTPNDDDRAVAIDVIDWLWTAFVEKPVHMRSDFERNVVAVIEGKADVLRVRAKNLNFLIWAIDGYKRELQRRTEKRMAQERTKASAHVGTVGDRITLDVTLRFRKVFATSYGSQAMCKFVDTDGNAILWWGTSETAFEMKLDAPYVVKATVKKHGEYEGVAQTEITRVAVLSGELEAA